MDKKIKSILDYFYFIYIEDSYEVIIRSKYQNKIDKHLSITFGTTQKVYNLKDVIDFIYYEGLKVKGLTEEELQLFIRAFNYYLKNRTQDKKTLRCIFRQAKMPLRIFANSLNCSISHAYEILYKQNYIINNNEHNAIYSILSNKIGSIGYDVELSIFNSL